MKYWPGVPVCAPRGLRTHICQLPSMHATANAENATQKCARHRRSAFRTGHPPLAVRLKFVFCEHLYGRPHLAVTQAAVFMARHQKVARAFEFRMDLRDKPGHNHRVDVRSRYEKAVDYIRASEAQSDT